MTQDESAIRDVVNTWFTASKSGDLPTVLDLMTDDVIFMVPGQPPFGKKAFAAASEGMKNVQLDSSRPLASMQTSSHLPRRPSHDQRGFPTSGRSEMELQWQRWAAADDRRRSSNAEPTAEFGQEQKFATIRLPKAIWFC